MVIHYLQHLRQISLENRNPSFTAVKIESFSANEKDIPRLRVVMLSQTESL
jgi:hypothetical protein